MSAANSVQAIIAHPPNPHPNLSPISLAVRQTLQPKELRVKLTATGICHTDLFVASLPPGPPFNVHYPAILGHEGAGIVEAVGESVTAAKPGDPVILSFNYCGTCDLCVSGRVSFCTTFNESQHIGAASTDVFTSESESEPILDKFFGQSSFAAVSIVDEKSVVNVRNLISSPEDLKVLAPLGCGLQTGAGAIVNCGRAIASDVVVVTGLGGVGMGAIMAAKIAGCRAIVAVDRVPSRLALAKELGASHLLDTSSLPAEAKGDFTEAVQALVEGARISIAIETTGVSTVIASSIRCLGKRGHFIQIGVPKDYSYMIQLPLADLFGQTKIIEGNIMGASDARDMVPKMVAWWKEGRFPVEKIVTEFKPEEIKAAVERMEGGECIKPVLVW